MQKSPSSWRIATWPPLTQRQEPPSGATARSGDRGRGNRFKLFLIRTWDALTMIMMRQYRTCLSAWTVSAEMALYPENDFYSDQKFLIWSHALRNESLGVNKALRFWPGELFLVILLNLFSIWWPPNQKSPSMKDILCCHPLQGNVLPSLEMCSY